VPLQFAANTGIFEALEPCHFDHAA
jgi:hypothetical protein